MNIEEEKKKIRKEIRRRRRELSSKTLSAIDNSLPEFISAIGDKELLKTLKNAKRIALYRAFDGEVPVDGLAKFFMDKGITCCFPRIENDRMVFCDCISLDDSEFTVSSLGIKEPDTSKPPVDPGDIDVVVLPALAYNEEGTRLGAGGGFYDRYIGSMGSARPYLLGICYEFQICSDVPSDGHDISADFIAVIPEEEYAE
ncbi:MAG: 5-formyltetrahydrofolate cyclo-ligase [Clostridiales bacterium]|nr:5-formyltetrahydrofolate cyclo-ligase [Clostridiales bacterium]